MIRHKNKFNILRCIILLCSRFTKALTFYKFHIFCKEYRNVNKCKPFSVIYFECMFGTKLELLQSIAANP